MHRLLCETPPLPGTRHRLGLSSRRHVRVWRLNRGDEVCLFDGQGGEWGAILLGWDDGGVDFQVGEARMSNGGRGVESPLRLELAQGLARGGRFEEVLQAGTELGVHAFHPLSFRRSLPGGEGQNREARWRKVIQESARQAGRVQAPSLETVRSSLAFFREPPEASLRLLLHPQGPTLGRRLADHSLVDSILVVVGPEGGMEEEEAQQAEKAGFLRVSLGPRILRTEHAGPAAVAILQHLRGDLGPA